MSALGERCSRSPQEKQNENTCVGPAQHGYSVGKDSAAEARVDIILSFREAFGVGLLECHPKGAYPVVRDLHLIIGGWR